MNPITPPTLEKFEKPAETSQPMTDETRRPDTADATDTAASTDLTDKELASQEAIELPDREGRSPAPDARS